MIRCIADELYTCNYEDGEDKVVAKSGKPRKGTESRSIIN
jgi:hypothetical protein